MKENDLRVIRTRTLIKDAFFKLLKEKDFEKISISDIADKAMINRGTIYLHYQDKYDLKNSLEEELIEKIEQCCGQVTWEEIEECYNSHTPFVHILKLLEVVEDSPEFFRLIANSSNGIAFYQKMGEKINAHLFDTLPELKADNIAVKYRKIATVSIFSGIVNQWIKDGMHEDKEEIALIITEIILNNWRLSLKDTEDRQ